MDAGAQGAERRRWLVAIAVAGLAFAGVAWLFRAPAPLPASAVAAPAGKFAVQLAPPGAADALLRQETELRDLRPLFLPTGRNAVLREPRREPGRTSLDEETPGVKLSDAELNVEPPIVALNGRPVGQATPVDALTPDADLAGLAGFGRRPAELQPLPPRGGFIRIVAAGDGTPVLAEPLPVAARPATEQAWVPLEYLASVDAIGLASPLVLTVGSRVEEVDAHYRRYLTRDFRLGARLPPGFYRITVAP